MREVQKEDKEMVRNWRNMPEVAGFMYADHYITPEEHAKWFQAMKTDVTRKYWVIQVDGGDAGLAYLHDIDAQKKLCYWGFYIADLNMRGKGVGSFVEYFILKHVFEEMEFDKICGEVATFNEMVLRMHKKFGFVEVGRIPRGITKGGIKHDIVRIEMRKEEWSKLRPEIEARMRAKGLITEPEGR